MVLSGTLAEPYSAAHDQLPPRAGHQRGRADRPRRRALGRLAEGRAGLDAARRTAFANDPLNLLAVDGPLNMAKGDGDAATWLPPNKAYRCTYVARQVAVKVSYGLWMTQAEKNAIATMLATCPDEPLPGGVVANIAAPVAAPAPAPAPNRPPHLRRSRLPLRLPAPAPAPGVPTTRTALPPGPPASRPCIAASPGTAASSTGTATASAASDRRPRCRRPPGSRGRRVRPGRRSAVPSPSPR